MWNNQKQQKIVNNALEVKGNWYQVYVFFQWDILMHLFIRSNVNTYYRKGTQQPHLQTVWSLVQVMTCLLFHEDNADLLSTLRNKHPYNLNQYTKRFRKRKCILKFWLQIPCPFF